MSKAFTKQIHSTSNDSHQTNPSWVVTFVRWSNRSLATKDELRFLKDNQDLQKVNKETKIDFFRTEDPLIVDSDCISASTTNSKSSSTPGAQVVLKMGKYNYLTAIAPGDFVFINMLDSQQEADHVVEKINKGEAINTLESGFKGVYKVQSVRKMMEVDKSTGAKSQMCVVQAYAFTELNNTIYFNPHLINRAELDNDFLFIANLTDSANAILAKKGGNNVQEIVAEFFKMFVGVGVPSRAKNVKGIEKTPNTHFFIPRTVGKLLGEPNAKAAKDIYNLVMGKQRFESGKTTNIQDGMNPTNFIASTKFPRIKFPKEASYHCEGTTHVQAEYWQQVTAYSIMQQYLNSPINEMFTSFKVDSSGYIMPTLTMRQIPFATEDYSDQTATKFLSLPRWKIDPDMIFSMNVGREESARFNFVQGFGRVDGVKDQEAGIEFQIAHGNYVSDRADIQKNGLRPLVFTSNFDSVLGTGGNKSEYKAMKWARLIADSVMGGHLKLNGSVTLPGVPDPISVGDNFQIGNTVFHIESVSHVCQQEPNGSKTFSTTLELSHGTLDNSSISNSYPEMANSNIEFYMNSDDNFGSAVSHEDSGVNQLQNAIFTSQKVPPPPPVKSKKPKKKRTTNRNKK